jgi:MoaA/NifB/PqqE/SkfB family radical SAM enzyme
MKVHRGAADLLAARAQQEGRPVTVTFQVTDRCNYQCVHCYQEHKDHRAEDPAEAELTFAEIDRILDELAEAGVLFLTLMGGEFFMRRDADEILAAAHAKGFALKLLTTGHHVTDRRADFLATLRPLQVDMSLYSGHAGHHEAVTRQPGSWERSVAAARRLIARRIPVLLKAPVMEVNAADVESLGVELRPQDHRHRDGRPGPGGPAHERGHAADFLPHGDGRLPREDLRRRRRGDRLP